MKNSQDLIKTNMNWNDIEEVRKYRREYYSKKRKENPLPFREAVRKSHNKNKEKRKIYRVDYEDKNKDKIRESSKKWKLKNKDKIRNQNLKRMYGITSQDYEDILNNQDNCCAICKIPKDQHKENRHMIVDHCHKTGKVRGILCSNCNKSLGLVKDNINTISNMLEYLKLNQ